jgi:nucleoid-associated protein YgaU
VEKMPEKVPEVAPAPVVVEEVRPEIKEETKDMASKPAVENPSPTEVRSAPPDAAAAPVGQDMVVDRGDTIDKLSRRVYGRSNDRVLGIIQKNNPAIKNPNRILPGQEIIFPPLPDSPQ